MIPRCRQPAGIGVAVLYPRHVLGQVVAHVRAWSRPFHRMLLTLSAPAWRPWTRGRGWCCVLDFCRIVSLSVLPSWLACVRHLDADRKSCASSAWRELSPNKLHGFPSQRCQSTSCLLRWRGVSRERRVGPGLSPPLPHKDVSRPLTVLERSTKPRPISGNREKDGRERTGIGGSAGGRGFRD